MRNAFGFGGGFGGGFQRAGRRGPAVVHTAMRISFDEAVKGTTKQVGGLGQVSGAVAACCSGSGPCGECVQSVSAMSCDGRNAPE